MPTYLLHHEHRPDECAVAYAAWKGFDSPLRHRRTLSSCVEGGHVIWWTVDVAGPAEALTLLPPYLAVRTQPIRVRTVLIP